MDSGRVHAGKPVRCPWCWTERGSSSLQQSRRISAPADMCTLAPLPEFPLGRVHTFFFSIHVSVCEDYILLRPTRSKKKKRKQAIIAMVCNTIHGTVKEAWEVNRIGCGGDCSPHVEKKESESLSSHRLQLYFNPEAHTVWPTQLNHMHIAISVKGPPEWKHKYKGRVFFSFFWKKIKNMQQWIQMWTAA